MSASWQQVATLYRGLSAAQRASVIVAALAVGAGIMWVATNRSQTPYVPVLSGRSFDKEELVAARKQLSAAGLTEFQLTGGQILVPENDATRYEAALTVDKAGETGWAGAWQQANASLGPFATGRQQQDAREIARARLISDLLAQLPDVAQAEIVWDEEPRVGWRQPPRVRATVYLQPRERRPITRDVVEAVKQAVAGSKAHLDPADVVVLDLQRMIAWGPGSGDDATAADEQRLAVMTAAYRQRIEDALADMDGVRVAVVVEPKATGIPAVLPEQQPPRELKAVSVTPTASANLQVQRSPKASGGPNVRLEVPRSVDTPDSENSRPIQIAAIHASSVAVQPATERVRVTVSLAPEFVRQQAESRHTAEAFARMPPVQQQAVLVDIERAVGRNVRERVAAIIPGTTLEDRLARVQIIPQLTVAADQSGSTPDETSQAENGTIAAHTDRLARWGIVGLMACLVVWTLYQIARGLRGRRSSQFVSRFSAERPGGAMTVPIAPAEPSASSASPDRVTQLLDSMEQMDGAGWARDVAHQPPQVIAALLKVLAPERVSHLLAGLPGDVQSEVLALLAGVGTTESAATPLLQPVRRQAALPRVNRREAEAAPRYRGWFQRRRKAAPEGSDAQWMEATVAEDASHLDQITELDPLSLRTRYAELPVDVWSTALMGASSAFRVRLLSALPAADAAALRQALTRQRPARLSEIESAQSQVLALLNGRVSVAAESP
jgi:hypothetical protein